jgi:flavin-dependent dehydrogenase
MLHTDLCVVGAGPAGISLALQVAESGADILLLESGGRRPDGASQALCAGEVADPALHPPANMAVRLADQSRHFGAVLACRASSRPARLL